jgi:hypothetical protein
MDNETSAAELRESISGDFSKLGLNDMILGSDIESIEDLKKYLIKKITELIDKNFDQLINALYQIDVDEKKIKELFLSKSKVDIPFHLSEMIIERQLQKIIFRKKYRSGEI